MADHAHPVHTHAPGTVPVDHEDHVDHVPVYLTLFFILLNYTLMEYFYAKHYEKHTLFIYMLGVAVGLTVALALAGRFLPIEFNRKWVYIPLIPALILPFFPVPMVLGLMILAVTKATLVGLYFMHLKYEGNWVYYMLVPAGFLACVFIFALYPDVGMQGAGDSEVDQEIEAATTSSEVPGQVVPEPRH